MNYTEKLTKLVYQVLMVFGFIYMLMLFIGLLGFIPFTDSTDSPDKRSGMTLYTDALTGCQYLGKNGLTPRLDANGKHLCEGEKQ